MFDLVPAEVGTDPAAGSKLEVRLMEVLDEEEDSFGILGMLAILLVVGALGRMLERERLAGTVEAEVTATDALTDADDHDDDS